MQKALLLLGQGGEGKGTLLNLLRAFLGRENVSSRTLHALAEERFASADLFGRLANICGDLDARTVERSDTFKMITGGDALTAERKFGNAFSFVPFALLAFSANAAPLSSDQTQGYFDRWLVIPMTSRFRGTAREDPHLLGKLTAPTELEGLLQLAVPALQRLMERGRFEVPASVREAGDRMRSELDSVLAFSEERLDPDGISFTSRADLYGAYTAWCQANGRRPLSSRNVYAKVLEHLPTIAERKREGVRGFFGIDLTDGAGGAEGAGFSYFPTRAREQEMGKPAPSAPSVPPAPLPSEAPESVEDLFTRLLREGIE
jgi:putative DNA primase/helicase